MVLGKIEIAKKTRDVSSSVTYVSMKVETLKSVRQILTN
jgi:hypothetical protein